MTEETTSYPRGRLKMALVSAALEIVERDGESAVTMRALAGNVGVSLAAAYKHFSDRADLLAAVVCEGYRDLLDRHGVSVAGHGSPAEKLQKTMTSFVDFSRKRPGLFQLMFNRPVTEENMSADVRQMEEDMYQRILILVTQLLPSTPERELRLHTISLWATLLGHSLGLQRVPLRSFVRNGLTDEDIDHHVIGAAITSIVAG